MAEIVLFRCDRRSASLTKAACAKFYLATVKKRPEPWDSLFKCRSCPVGAAHAGGGTTPIDDAKAREAAARQQVIDEWKSVCPRCLRLSARLIKGNLCVSCYNRSREVEVGKNRKGSAPKLLPSRLCTVTMRIIDASGSRVENFTNVTGSVEAMVQVAKKAAGPVAFGRVVPVVLAGDALEQWCSSVERQQAERVRAERRAWRLDRDRRHRPGAMRACPAAVVVQVVAPSPARRKHQRRQPARVESWADAAD